MSEIKWHVYLTTNSGDLRHYFSGEDADTIELTTGLLSLSSTKEVRILRDKPTDKLGRSASSMEPFYMTQEEAGRLAEIVKDREK